MILAAPTLVMLLALLVGQQPAHDRAYWTSIKSHNFEVPAGASAPALAGELSGLLGSTDPELRDDLAYSILNAWIVEKKVLGPADMRTLLSQWTANLKRSIGETGDNTVLLRSFSVLSLSMIAERNGTDPFLTPTEHAALLDTALAYLANERDLRGFDDRLGWIHSAAHTADLIKFLARSPDLAVAKQRAILDAFLNKMRDASVVFTFGEDERASRAISQLLIRSDFDLDGFKEWVTRMAAPLVPPVTAASLRSKQNRLNLLSKLGILLARQPTLPPLAAAARDTVIAAAKF